MKKILCTLFVTVCLLTLLWGQGSGPYAAFGCEGTVLDVPAASDGIFEYANADTSSECRKILLDTKLHIVAFLDKNDSVLHTAAVRREMMLRWFAPDPANQYWSGYVAMGNNPVSMVDPDGRQTNGESTQNKNVVSRTDQLWGTEKAGKGMTGSEQISLGYRNYGGDYSGSFMDYTYLVADAINSINPAAAWMDYGAYLLYRTDRFGNPMSTVQATIVGASIFIPVSRSLGAEIKSSLWTATKSQSAVENAYGHWIKHGSDFPQYQNAKQYVQGAQNFLHNPPSGTLMKIRPSNGDILKYHPESNTFGVMNSLGIPKSMFKPEDGIEYWFKQ